MGSMVIEKAPTNKQKVTNRQLIILVLYLIPLAIISTYPLIFSQYGEVYLLTPYGSLIAYFIMGAALIAIGVFVSSLTENQGLRVWIYGRLSNDDDIQMDSLENQMEIGRCYAESHDYSIIGESYDDNVSCMRFDREGLNQLTQAADAGKIDAVIVKDLSRLGRHKIQTALYIDYLRQRDIAVLSATEGLNTLVPGKAEGGAGNHPTLWLLEGQKHQLHSPAPRSRGNGPTDF